MTQPSLGDLFERVDKIRTHTTEHYEQELAGVVYDLLVVVREHFSCHDCNVPEHRHELTQWTQAGLTGAKTGGVTTE